MKNGTFLVRLSHKEMNTCTQEKRERTNEILITPHHSHMLSQAASDNMFMYSWSVLPPVSSLYTHFTQLHVQ